ncbi:MAG: hypothetical protein AAFZ49_14450, partial [Cyanobacteria bacterium J06659_2]
MSKQQHLTLLAQGVPVWNRWREQAQAAVFNSPAVWSKSESAHQSRDLDLREALLAQVDLRKINLSHADCCMVTLKGSD